MKLFLYREVAGEIGMDISPFYFSLDFVVVGCKLKHIFMSLN